MSPHGLSCSQEDFFYLDTPCKHAHFIDLHISIVGGQGLPGIFLCFRWSGVMRELGV